MCARAWSGQEWIGQEAAIGAAGDQRAAASPGGVEAERAGAVGGQHQEAAGHGHVLPEVDRLRGVAEVPWNSAAAGQRERGQRERDPAGEAAGEDGQAAAEFQRDHQRQQAAGHAHGFHVLLGGGVAGDLAPAGNDEDQRQAEAAEQREGSVHGRTPLCVVVLVVDQPRLIHVGAMVVPWPAP